MIRYTCDLCAKEINADVETRFVLNLESTPVTPTMDLTDDDLSEDHLAELSEMLNSDAELPDVTPTGIKKHYDLCRSCHDKFLAQPLQTVTMKVSFSSN